MLAVAFIFIFCSCRGHLDTQDGNSSLQQLNTQGLSDTVKAWANAYYQNDPDTYIKYSFKNKECMTLLGNTDYDFDSIYSSAKNELNDYAEFMSDKYSFYYVQAEPSDYEIYEKESDIYNDYLNKLSELYKNADIVDAFALVEFYIRIDYEQDSSMTSDKQVSKVECMMIGNNWYVIN